MLRDHSLLRNSGFLLGTTVATSGLGYLYWGLAAHTYDPRAVGIASAFISLFGLTSFLGAMGVSSINVQMLPKLRHSRTQWNSFFTASLLVPTVLTAALAAVGGVVLSMTNERFATLREGPVLAAFVFGAAATTNALAFDAAFVSLRRSDQHLVRNSTFAVAKIPLLVAPLIFRVHPGVLGILLSWDVALALSLLLAMVFLLRRSRPAFRWRVHTGLRQFLAQGRALLGYQLETLGGMLPAYVIPPLIVAVLGPSEAAVFYYTWSIGAFFFAVSSSVAQALFAEGANAAALRVQATHALAVCAALLGPVIVVVLVFAHQILEVFGTFYADRGAGTLRLCIVASVPDAITNVWVALLLVRRRLREAALLNWMMAVATMIATVVLLPMMGLEGVGWAWILGQSLGAVAALMPLWRLLTSGGMS
ncbi:MAG TPA: hypothetical protein VI248_05240 [Kineosporiaceae bacterium]